MAEIQLAEVFVEMADTLVDEFDVIDFLHVIYQAWLGQAEKPVLARRRRAAPDQLLTVLPCFSSLPVKRKLRATSSYRISCQ